MAKALTLNQDELLRLLNKSYTNYGKSPKSRITASYIESRTESLTSLWEKFQRNHEKLVQSSSTDKEVQESSYFTQDTYEQFEEAYIEYKAKMKDDLKSFDSTPSTSKSQPTSCTAMSSSPHCEVRLPLINLPQFSSGYEEWQSFHDMFVSLIHNNERLSAVQKMHYLKSCLRGEAENVLKNLATTETNYNEAWLQLTKRYNNKRFNTNEVLKKLFAQKANNAESSTAIKQLLDTTSACLKSLANLSVDTKSWDALIIYLVVTKLDQETRKQWELHLSQTSSDELSSWEQLKIFLETRFRTIEMLEGAKPTTKSKSFHAVEKKNKSKCVMCDGEHYLYQCKKFTSSSPKDRTDYVKTKGLCFNCLAPNHSVKICRQSTSCRRCGRRHHTLLHLERDQEKEKTQESTTEEPHTQSIEKTNIISNFSKNFSPSEVLLATAVVRANSINGVRHVIRALIDQGSQASFITEDTVQLLGLKRKPINGLVSGVGDGHTRVKYMVSLHIESRHHLGKSISVNAYVLGSLTSMLPSKVVHSTEWLELEKLPLADPEFTSPSKVDVLLGAEIYSEILKSGVIKSPSRNLIAQNTVLGWIISGKVTSDSISAKRVISMHTQIREDDLLKKFWELEKEPDTNQKIFTEEEIKCQEIFDSTTKRNEDGRYVVKLPFNSDDPECQYGKTMEIAKHRFISLEKRLSKQQKLGEEYAKVIEEYKVLNHMKPVPKEDIDNPKAVYLPHHAVVREDKDTTKVRVVFDASCKGVNDVSLNDNLLVGPKLQQDLQHLLLRWRTYRICIIADLVKMYRQVCVNEQDIDYQRILWRPNMDGPIEHYQLLTLTFGTACAPYLAVKALHQLAEDEKLQYPIGARITKSDLYMDDLMTGCENEIDAIHIFEELSNLMKSGGFQFQKWSSNSNELLEYIGQEGMRDKESVSIKMDRTLKILGITWNRADDTFEYVIKLPPVVTPVTKRKVLSDIAMLFDPLGWVAPTITTAKVFIQKLWLAGIEWDQELPDCLLKDWLTYRQELYTLSEFSIPRWIGNSNSDKCLELQGFCDASNVAYAAVVYARVIDEHGKVRVNLICSKTKVAPVKQVSIPRLELCGAVLLAKLLSSISKVLQVSKENVHAWTDSSVVLAWLSSHPTRWKTFIANRTSDILTQMDSNQWSHVRSEDNPADCASRGIKAAELAELKLWKTGPNWLEEKEVKYNKGVIKETNLKKKKSDTVCLAQTIEKKDSEEFIERFSNLTKLLRVLSYCRRWLELRVAQNERRKYSEYPTVEEMNETLLKLIGVVQASSFKEEIDDIRARGSVLKRSVLHTLCPLVDSKGTLRVGGRLDRAELSYDKKHPIILPDKSHFTRLVIRDAHLKTIHGGTQIMLNHIRYKYFIIRARVQVKKYYRSCVTCRRYSSANRTQLMGQIPEVRLKPSKVFKSSGVDYSGPINLRFSPGRGSKAYKGYICIFVCMSTRAIHLEAASDLTAQGFIAAFRRFTARRGHCKDIYSDNGTNFVGSSKQLIGMLKNAQTSWPNEIIEQLTLESTTWHFIPPYSPNFGGIWEAGVRSMKNHLKKTIGDSTLTFEELTTVLTQIEACLNSRPISVLSDDPCDPLPLTPGHFLVGEPLINVADEDHQGNDATGLNRWKLCQRMVSSFWKRWSKEYIVNLSQRYKWNQKLAEPNVNDVVVIREDNIPPAKWLLGKIVQKYPGHDNITRVVMIKTKNGMTKRPVSKISVLTN